MDKIDLKKELAGLYNPTPEEVTLVDVPAMNFIMIDGRGAPGQAAPGRFFQVIPGKLPPGDPIQGVGHFGLDPGSQPVLPLVELAQAHQETAQGEMPGLPGAGDIAIKPHALNQGGRDHKTDLMGISFI